MGVSIGITKSCIQRVLANSLSKVRKKNPIKTPKTKTYGKGRKMPSITVKCPFCKMGTKSERYLAHILSNHKEEFFEAHSNNFHSDTYLDKPLPLLIAPTGSLPLYCCFGCHTSWKSKEVAVKHFGNKDCSEKHAQYLKDIRGVYAKKAVTKAPSSLSPTLIRKVQELVWDMLETIKMSDEEHNHDYYTKKIRKDIPFALDEETLKRLFGREEPEPEKEVEEVVEEEVDETFLVVQRSYKTKKEAFLLLDEEEQREMREGGFDPDDPKTW
jgi:hypothetical protein